MVLSLARLKVMSFCVVITPLVVAPSFHATKGDDTFDLHISLIHSIRLTTTFIHMLDNTSVVATTSINFRRRKLF